MSTRFGGVLCIVALCALGACGGGSSAPSALSSTNNAPVLLTPLSSNNIGSASGPSTQGLQISLTAAGAGQFFLAGESAYTGTITQTNTCAGIAAASPSSGSGPAVVFHVTATAAGSCTITVQDATGQQAFALVVVTTSTGNINSAGRRSAL